jgi:hypothetical protein
MKIKVPNKNYGITELYDTVAALMGREEKELNYDCRCINVAMNIQHAFFAHYREENPNISDGDFNVSMAMMLLNYGPKVDESLADDEVEVFDGFIC